MNLRRLISQVVVLSSLVCGDALVAQDVTSVLRSSVRGAGGATETQVSAARVQTAGAGGVWFRPAAQVAPQGTGPGTAVDSKNFGTAQLGATTPVRMTLTYTAAQGVAKVSATVNGDFVVESSTCGGSGACSAVVSFTPQRPGLRTDAVQATNANGLLVQKTYVYGVGMGPQFGFDLGNATIYQNQANRPTGIAVGQDNRVYVADQSGTFPIYRFDPGMTNKTALPLTGLGAPNGIAVDGSNTVYIADGTNNRIVTLNSANVQGSVTTSQLKSPTALAVDGTGALYISDTGNNRVLKIDNQGLETVLATGLNSPQGVAVDAAGNVFFADLGTGGEIFEVPIANGKAFVLMSGLDPAIRGVALDGGGKIYYTGSQGIGTISPYFQRSNYGNAGADSPLGIALDGSGNIYLTFPVTGPILVTDRSAGNQILSATAGQTATSGQQVSNTGNAALNLASVSINGPTFTILPGGSTCGASTSVLAGEQCLIAFAFNPPAAQRYDEVLTVTSNSLNRNSTNTYALAGLGSGNQAASTTKMDFSQTSVGTGQQVPVTVTVTGSGTAVPTGTFSVSDGTTVIASGTLAASGSGPVATGTYFYQSYAAGTHQVTATYAGDSNYAPSTSAVQTVTVGVQSQASTTTLSASPSTVTVGQSVQLTATVGGTNPQGTVVFFEQGRVIGQTVVSTTNGVTSGSLAVKPTFGTHVYTSEYNGDGTNMRSTSAPQTVTVNAAPVATTSTLALSAASITVGQAETLTVTIVGGTGSPALTGSVNFFDNTVDSTLGNVTVTPTSTGGTAVLTVSMFAVGTHSIGARYSGDANYLASNTPNQTVTVTAVVANITSQNFGSLAIGSAPVTMTINYGTIASTITAATTFSQDLVVVSAGCGPTGCTVGVKFAPSFPGLREDFVTVKDGNGNVVAKTYVYGVGLGPQLGFDPGLRSGSGLSTGAAPSGVAVGPDDTVYLTDTGNNKVLKLGNTGLTTLPVQGLVTPTGIAVDGGNTIYIADQGTSQIVSYSQASGVQGTVASSALNGPTGVAVDGAGALYITDTGNNRIIRIDNQGNETTLVTGVASLYGIAVDGAGNVFYTDAGSGGEITELPAGGGQKVVLATGAGPGVRGLAVEPSGKVYFQSDGGLKYVITGNPVAQSVFGNKTAGAGVALRKNGTIVSTYPATRLYETTDQTTGNLGRYTGVGASGTLQLKIVDTGNQPLTVSNFSFTGTVFSLDAGNQCVPGTVLAAAQTCNLTVLEKPTALGQVNETLTVTSNSLNAAAATNQYRVFVIGIPPSTTVLTASTTTPAPGQAVTFTAVVSDASGPTPTGSVTFRDNGVLLLTVTTPTSTTASSATFAFTTTSLGLGAHVITANYNGSQTVGASGAEVTVTVAAAVVLTLTGVTPNSGQVGDGATTVTLTGTGFTTGSVARLNGVGVPTTFVSATSLSAILPVALFAKPGVGLITVTDPAATSASAAVPFVVRAVASAVLQVTPGVISTFAGVGTAGNTGDLGPSKAAQLNKPRNGVVDALGNVYFADTGNNTIRRIDTAGVITTFAGGSGGASGGNGDGGPATAAILSNPMDVAQDGLGNFYIAETGGGRIRRVDSNGGISTFAGGAGGASGGVGDGGPANRAFLNSPTGVASDLLGNVYIADPQSNRVRKVDLNGIITTVAGTGSAGYAGDGGAATSALLNQPYAVRLDGAGNLYIADRGNHVIRQVTVKGLISTVAGTPTGGTTADGVPATTAALGDPVGLAVDGGGNFYIADLGNRNVRRVTASGVISTVAGNGVAGYTGDGSAATLATLQGPTGVAIDPAGNLYLFDNGNNVIRQVSSSTAAVVFAPTAVGQSAASQTLTITNVGNVPVLLSGIPGADSTNSFILSGTCLGGLYLATNDACQLRVDFSPKAGGAQTFKLDLPVQSAGGTLHLSFSGTGTGTAQTITFPAIPNHAVGDAPFALNATASSGLPVSYTVVSGPATVSGNTVTLTGTQTGQVVIQAMQAGNATFLAATPVTQSFFVSAPAATLTKLSPAGAVIGSPAVTLTVTGTNFNAKDFVLLNGAPLKTTFVNATTMTAVIPATQLGAAAVFQISVTDSNTEGGRTGTLPFTVTTAPVITLSGPPTANSGGQPGLTLSLPNPYPVPLTVTLTLTFAPTGSTAVDDPMVQFLTGGRTLTFVIPANSTATPLLALQTGTVAGTATITLGVAANGVNVTPPTATPVVITIPPAAPVVTTAALAKANRTLTVVVHGFSNTRELTTAVFHFTPAAGSSIKTPDVTAPVTAIFAQWFGSTQSAQFGSSFTYSQDFTLSDDASHVGTVTVTLVNSLGQSTPGSAQ